MKNLLITLCFLFIAIITASAQEIFDAIRNGDITKVKQLVEENPSSLQQKLQWGDTPLHLAALVDNAEIAQYLIDKGADINALNGSFYTPLMRAQINVAKVLVRNGADINYEAANGNGSALTVSLWQETKDVTDFLLDNGAKLPDKNIQFWLKKALEKGCIKYFDAILRSGYNTHTVSESQNTLIHYAAASNSVELVEKLIKLDIPTDKANIFGWTPLHVAASKGNKEMVELFINKGLDKDQRTTDGHSPFNLAIKANKRGLIDYLKSIGADQTPQKFPVLEGKYFGEPKPGEKPVPFAPGIIASGEAFHGSVSFAPDGTEAYWTSGRATYCSKIQNGKWTKPDTITGLATGDAPFVSLNGKKIYFLAQQAGGARFTKEIISVMERTGSGWSEPKPLPEIINSVPGIHFQLSTDAKGNLYFGARQNGTVVSGVYFSEYKDGKYGPPIILETLKNVNAHSPFIAPDGSYLLFTTNIDELSIIFQRKDGSWTERKNVSEFIGMSGACPFVTYDNKYLFFRHIAGEKGIPYWVDASFIENLRKEALKDDK